MRTIYFLAFYIQIFTISVLSDNMLVVPADETNYPNQVYRPLANGAYNGTCSQFTLDLTRGQGVFLQDDFCIVLQVKDDTEGTNNIAGFWELLKINSVVNSNISVLRYENKKYTYKQDGFKRACIYKIPYYEDVIISGIVTSIGWDGYVGGVMAMSANNFTLCNDGTVIANSKGFSQAGGLNPDYAENYNSYIIDGGQSGGAGGTADSEWGAPGGAGAPGAGAGGKGGDHVGTYATHGGGGGGGGGRPPYSGSNPSTNSERLYLGGGSARGGQGGSGGTYKYNGGAGGSWNGITDGKAGGGLIFIISKNMFTEINSIISSVGGQGGTGGEGTRGVNGGGGGTGSIYFGGGTIYILSQYSTSNGTTDCSGGNGGSAGIPGAGGSGIYGGGGHLVAYGGSVGVAGQPGNSGSAGRLIAEHEAHRPFFHEVILINPISHFRTNSLDLSLDVMYGSGLPNNQRYISTNSGSSWFSYNSNIHFTKAGVYYWSAMALDVEFNQHYAVETNKLTIVTTLPTVNLLSPLPSSVYSNRFAIPLIADYGSSDFARQLSTNAGTSWFDYNPGVPVVFPTTGSWFWTARGLNAEGWSYANKTNYFFISAVLTNGYAVFLGTPQNDAVVTNTSPLFSIATFGSFNYWGLATNGQAFFSTTFPTTAALGKGLHSWTARGTYLVPSMTHVNSPTTNSFEVIDPQQQSAVRLMAPENIGRRPVGYVFFDVMYASVASPQLSTNNGATWFEYDPPVFFSDTGIVFWTARGMNASSEWVYANSTNVLSLEQFDFIDPVANYVKINGGAQFVNTQNVTLALSATDDHLDTMRIGNNAGFSGAGWWPYSTSTNWTLPSGDGGKTVYAQFRDVAGNVSAVISSNTILDMTAPVFSNIALSRYAAPVGVVTSTVWLADALAGLDYAVAPNVHLATASGRTAAFVQVSYATGVWRGVATIQSGDDGMAFVNVLGAADRAANTMQPRWHATNILVDTTAPTNTSILINAGAAYTSNRTVTLSIHAEDITAIEMMIDNSVGFPSGVWEAYSTTKKWTLAAGDGLRVVYVKFRDAVLNESLAVSDSIIVDTTPPSGESVTINGGAAYTSNRLVTLALSAFDLYLADMRVSEQADFIGAGWQAYQASTNWQLSAADGSKTIYAQFRDAAGNMGAVAQASIVYDGTAPTVLSAIPTPDPAKVGAVTITVTFVDADAGMDTAVPPTVYFATMGNRTQTVTQASYIGNQWAGIGAIQPGDDGPASIHVLAAVDRAGNVMAANHAAGTITIDTLAPSNVYAYINDNAIFTSSRNVTISNRTIGATLVDIANTSTFAVFSTTNYMPLLPWQLDDREGTNTVYLRYRDDANNTAYTNDWIILDRTAPSGIGVSINGGAGFTSNTAVTLTLSASDLYLADMRVANAPSFAGASWVPFASATNWTLIAGDGTKTVYAQFRDAAGNTSAVAQASIVLDTVRPGLVSLIVAGDPAKAGAITAIVTFADATAGMDTAAVPTMYFATENGRTGMFGQVLFTGSVWRAPGMMAWHILMSWPRRTRPGMSCCRCIMPRTSLWTRPRRLIAAF
ncbi:MAG: hypothetical protein NTV22_13185 [bacterium]|nr:hypothetical protein [bacterium]